MGYQACLVPGSVPNHLSPGRNPPPPRTRRVSPPRLGRSHCTDHRLRCPVLELPRARRLSPGPPEPVSYRPMSRYRSSSFFILKGPRWAPGSGRGGARRRPPARRSRASPTRRLCRHAGGPVTGLSQEKTRRARRSGKPPRRCGGLGRGCRRLCAATRAGISGRCRSRDRAASPRAARQRGNWLSPISGDCSATRRNNGRGKRRRKLPSIQRQRSAAARSR